MTTARKDRLEVGVDEVRVRARCGDFAWARRSGADVAVLSAQARATSTCAMGKAAALSTIWAGHTHERGRARAVDAASG